MMQRLQRGCLLGHANSLGLHIILLGSGDLRGASDASTMQYFRVFPLWVSAHMLAGKLWIGGLLGWHHAAYRSALTGEVDAEVLEGFSVCLLACCRVSHIDISFDALWVAKLQTHMQTH